MQMCKQLRRCLTCKFSIKMSTLNFDLVQTACQQHINEHTKHSPEKDETNLQSKSSIWKTEKTSKRFTNNDLWLVQIPNNIVLFRQKILKVIHKVSWVCFVWSCLWARGSCYPMGNGHGHTVRKAYSLYSMYLETRWISNEMDERLCLKPPS